jgi:hypothetical protein
MNKKRHFLLSAVLATTLAANAQVTIQVDASNPGVKVSPNLYGIFFEDINHAADGGLYAELISNRSFEDDDKNIPTWKTAAQEGAKINAQLINKGLLNKAQGKALQLTIAAKPAATASLINEGFWGINAVQGRTYKLSFWAKGSYKGGLKARLTNAKGDKVYAETSLNAKVGKKWTKYTAELTANANDAKAQFELVADGKGTIVLDVVSLFPPTFKNRENGLRPDLAQLLYNIHPKFVRFPGGCYVEGQESPENAFHWEKTIGPIEERPGHKNVNWRYRTSDGMGFDEYLQLAEDLNAKPLYVVNVGLWHGGMTPVDSIQPWIDECMNALEYANGPVTSKYGALRAKNGHPEPYNIEYLEIGNENNQPDPAAQSDHYYERFKKFKDAVLAKYPKMHLIGNVVAWGDDNPKWESNESVELLDEHYYRNPAWFAENFNKYDNYDRKGSSTITTYVESASGVAEGGKSGLTSFFVGLMFILSIFLAPIFLLIPSAATSGALVMVGVLMIDSFKKIELEDISESFPAFITMITMVLCYSIADGICLGILSYVLIKMMVGKFKDLNPTLYILSVFLLFNYVFS